MQDIDDVSGAILTPASEDASFRRYFRAQKNGTSRIVMDAPPDKEDCEPFIRVAAFLEAMQLTAPRVLARNAEQGFLLLSDLGSTQYLPVLQQQPQSADQLYGDALNALVHMQSRGSEYQSRLPPYDEALLRFELSLFSDWLCERHLAIDIRADENWQVVCDLLVQNALSQPRVFVHRDYHSRNLMLVDAGNPGILDFQDAVEGPYTYDVVSLLKDCYVSWPAERVARWAATFFAERTEALGPGIDEALFRRHFDLMGVQRQLKAAGIFSRLNHRDGKPGYMLDIPRTLAYVQALAGTYGELDWLAELVTERVLPGLSGTAR